MVSAIEPYGILPPFYDPYLPAEPPAPKGYQMPVEYRKDTLKKAGAPDETWGFLYPEMAAVFQPQPLNGALTPVSSRPVIEPPSVHCAKLGGADEEITKLLAPEPAAKSESRNSALDKSLAEVLLLQAFIQCMKVQRDHSEVNAELTLDTVQKNQEANKKIKEEYFNKLDEKIQKNKQSTILKWLNYILYGLLSLVGLASLALTLTASVVTLGAAIPTFITTLIGVVNGILAITAGSTTIFKGVLDHKSKKVTGAMEEKKWERLINIQIIKAGMDEMRQSMEVVAENWKQVVEVVNNWLKASLNQ